MTRNFAGTGRDLVVVEKCKVHPDTKSSFTTFSKACPLGDSSVFCSLLPPYCHSQCGCRGGVELSIPLCTHEVKWI